MLWLAGDPIPRQVPAKFYQPYALNLSYIRDFLVASHPYRKGQVCPFVQTSLAVKGTQFSAIDAVEFNDAWHPLMQRIEAFSIFKAQFMDARTSLTILLPDNIPESVHLKLQSRAKKICVQKHLMIGALYPASEAPSLHNEDYFPLRTPTPTLVLRDLVPMDMQFLTQDRHNLMEKHAFLMHYIEKFRNSKSADILAKVQHAIRYRNTIRVQLFVRTTTCSLVILLGGYLAYW